MLKETESWKAAADDFRRSLEQTDSAEPSSPAAERLAETQRKNNCSSIGANGNLDYWRVALDFCLGNVASIEGMLDAAVTHFQTALKRCPNWVVAHSSLAAVYLRQEKLDQALIELRKAQTDNPDAWRVYLVRGAVLFEHGRHEEAITALRAGLNRFEGKHSPRPLLLGTLALALHASKSHDPEAEKVAQQAIALDAKNVAGHIVLAEQAFEGGKLNDALEHSQNAVDSNGQSVAAWLLQGDVLQVQGKATTAASAHVQAVKLWKQTRQHGAPPQRMLEVIRALDAGQAVPLRLPGSWPVTATRLASVSPERTLPTVAILEPQRRNAVRLRRWNAVNLR